MVSRCSIHCRWVSFLVTGAFFLSSCTPLKKDEAHDISDAAFLHRLLADTWACLDAMIDPVTGLPRDTQKPGGATNTTNIGLYLASLCAATQIGLVESKNGIARVEKILASLESFERVKGFMPNFIPVDLSDKSSHGVMAVSDFNKLAVGLIMVRQTWPEFSERITKFLDVIEWGQLYNPSTGNTSFGFDLDARKAVGDGQLWLTSDTRLATFMLIATEAAPPELWDRLIRDGKETSAGRITAPGYGFGAIFMHAMDGMFIDEIDTEVGESVGNLAWHQIQFASKRGYPLWGWSNCYIPGSGYTEGGYLPERVVTPNAVALVVEYYPSLATAVLREMVRRGGSVPPSGYEGNEWGLRDSYDLASDTWDDRYLSLDQSMVFLSLANHLYCEVVRKIYTSDPLIRHGLELLEPHIEHKPELIERWAERDRIPVAKVTAAKKAAESVDAIPLDDHRSSDDRILTFSGVDAGGVQIAIEGLIENGWVQSTFQFPAIDISALDRIDMELEIIEPIENSIGAVRLLVEDRYGQRRYAHLDLDPVKKKYTVNARDLFGILYDDAAVQQLHFEFARAPWFYTTKRITTHTCKINVNKIEFVTR